MSKSHTIFDNFELNGFWWLPEAGMKYKGSLTYSNEGIILKIIEEHNPFKQNRIPIILGQTEKGFITLIDGLVLSADKTLFTSEGSIHISTLKLVFNKMIVGERYNHLEEVKFNSLDVKLTGLELWYLADPFTNDFEKSDFFSITFDRDTIIDFNIKVDSLCANFGSSYTVGESGNMFIDKRLHFTPYIKITPDKPQSLKWFEKTVWKLKNLYTLLLKSPIQIESLIANIGEHKEANIYPIRFEEKKDLKVNWFEVKPLSLPSLKENLETVFNNWFDSKAESSQLLYSHTINSQHKMILEDIFINYTKALESYHRNCTEQGTFITEERYNSVVEKMIEAVEEDITNDLKSKLKATLKFANEFGFQRRIKELVKGLPEKFIVEIDTFRDWKKFADKVRNTRDQLTHYSDSKADVFSHLEMIYVNTLLRILTMVYLLRDLGIQDEVIVEAIFKDNTNFGLLEKINEVLC